MKGQYLCLKCGKSGLQVADYPTCTTWSGFNEEDGFVILGNTLGFCKSFCT